MSAINQHPSHIDRAGELRTNKETLELLWSKAQILHCVDGRIASRAGALAFQSASDIATMQASGEFAEGSRYFLGQDPVSRAPFFAWDTSWKSSHNDEELQAISQERGLATLRELGGSLSDQEMELSLHAIALSNWHRAHPMCPRCGGPTRVDLGGAARLCEVDGSQHHPRTDSADRKSVV